MIVKTTVVTQKPGLYPITGAVRDAVNSAGVADGVCAIACNTATAGVLLAACGDGPGHEDILDDLARIFPPRTNYTSAQSPERAAAHTSAALCGRPLDCIVAGGQLVLGPAQGIYLLDTIGGRQLPCSIVCL